MNFAVVDRLCDFSSRARILLKAACEFLENADTDSLCKTVYYDEAECDGHCLINDIKVCLEEFGKVEGKL